MRYLPHTPEDITEMLTAVGVNSLDDLFATIEARKGADPETSYTASLFQKGQDAILQKVGEEAIEVVLAARGQGDQRTIEETADLFYHVLVMLAYQGLTLEDVEAELRKRHGE